MGQTCSPDNKPEREVKNTDAEDIKNADKSGDKNQAHLIDILNSYTAKNEELEKENALLKEKSQKDDKTAGIQDELEKMKQLLAQKDKELMEKDLMIKEEEDRVAKLKLQSELREQEARLLMDAQKAITLIEGNLLKFGKGGKGKPKTKMVEIMVRKGERADNGYSPGQLILSYADDEKATEMTRSHVTKLLDGTASKNKGFEGRTFSFEVEPNNKLVAFAAETVEEKEKWYNTILAAMEGFQKETKEMNEDFSFTHEFQERPLGFRVEERFVTGEDKVKTEVLMVTMIQETHEHLRLDGIVEGLVVTSCNDTDFTKLKYPEKLEILKGIDFPIKLTFEGKKYLQAQDALKETHRDVSMQLLYPELFAALTTDGSDARKELYNHPLVQSNPEIKKWLDRPDFKDLLQDLMSDPEKLRDFLMNKKL